MKRLMMLVASVLILGGVASAQQSKTDETLEYRPHWDLQVQGGVAHTLGEVSFGELISPAAQLSASYHFHHAMAVRLGLGGWQGKGGVLVNNGYGKYAYQFGQLNADFLLDLTSLFGGFNHKRVVSTYLLAGVGGIYGFNNTEAAAYKNELEYYWDGGQFLVPGRFGLGIDFRLGKVVSLGIEGNANVLSDKFNSKKAGNADWQFNLLAGLKFHLGSNTRPSKAYADKIAAEEAAAEALRAAEKAAAEKAAAEKAAAEKRAAAEKAAAEERAAAERMALAKANSKDVFFTIGSSHIRKEQAAKIEALANWLNANPDFSVAITGYADKETGTAKGNMELSQKRSEAVKAMLLKLGVTERRITDGYKGDTVQPFENNEQNRVVICNIR